MLDAESERLFNRDILILPIDRALSVKKKTEKRVFGVRFSYCQLYEMRIVDVPITSMSLSSRQSNEMPTKNCPAKHHNNDGPSIQHQSLYREIS